MSPIPHACTQLSSAVVTSLLGVQAGVSRSTQDKPIAGRECSRGSLGMARPPRSDGAARRRLPTILEEESEAQVAMLESSGSAPISRGHKQPLTNPLILGSSQRDDENFVARLKAACKTERSTMLAWLKDALLPLAFSMHGAVVAQEALKIATGPDRIMLVSEFHGSVIQMCISPTGHQVLATLIETMPVSALEFVADELAGKGGVIARHRFGYRVLEVMIMHCRKEQIANLANELLHESIPLSKHQYGSRVIEHLVEYGTDECRSELVRLFKPEMPSISIDRIASRIVAKALEYSDAQERCLLAIALLQASSPVSLADVACSRCGSSILREMARSNAHIAEFQVELASVSGRLAKSKFGLRVLHSFGLQA